MPESRVALRSAETDAHAQHVRTRELSPAFSLFLDIVRFAAALIVFLEHAKPMGLVGSLGLLDGLSGEAVIAFFVLSGFIIETTTRRERGWRHFALARAARIYSVFIPALVLGLVLKLTAALVLNRALLHELWTFDLAPWRLAASALFLGQAWTLQVPLPWNGAVWSLHFEVIYYVLFGFLAFAPRAWRLPAAMIVCALAGPKILLLMPCWWLGVWIAKHPHLGLPNRWTAWAVLLGAPALMVALNHAGMHEVVRGYLMDHVPAYWRLDDARSFPTWSLDGLLITATFIAARQLDAGRMLLPIAKPIRWAAGFTFSLYLFHRPMQNFVAQMYPQHRFDTQESAALLGLMLLAVVILGSLTEQKKYVWQRWLGRVLGGSAPVAPHAHLPERSPALGFRLR